MFTSEEKVLLDGICKLLGMEDLKSSGYNFDKVKDRVLFFREIKIRIIYNKFDLEATRREKKYLIKMLSDTE
jgi:hypothetical protein